MSLVNFATSIYAGIVIFAILGFKANLDHQSCLMEREQHIDYYLADYNLKVIDYGKVFRHAIDENEKVGDEKQVEALRRARQQTTNSLVAQLSSAASSEIGLKTEIKSKSSLEKSDPVKGTAEDDRNDNSSNKKANHPTGKADDGDGGGGGDEMDYYDAEDAIASIRSLDRQLETAAEKNVDVGDSDIEFIIDASSLISKQDLEKIIADIPGLPSCSIRQQLDDATQGTGLVFVVITEAISKFDNAPTWAIVFFLMLLTLGLDSQFGNLEGLLSSVTDLKFIGGTTAISRQWITGKGNGFIRFSDSFAFACSIGRSQTHTTQTYYPAQS